MLKDFSTVGCAVYITFFSGGIHHGLILCMIRARMVSQKPVVNDLDVDSTINTWKKTIAQMETTMASAESEEEKTSKLNFCFFKVFSAYHTLHFLCLQ